MSVPAEAPPCSVLTSEQHRFLWLHARRDDPPMKWSWQFGSSALRAYTEGGHTATISCEALQALCDAGLLIYRGPDRHDCDITDKGRTCV